MVGTATGRVALFSIHPQYADAILDGTKQVEFRRQGLPDDVSHVVVYATSPVQRVVGAFEIEAVEQLSPEDAWNQYGQVGGIDKHSYDSYYAGAVSAYVIRVQNPEPFEVPFTLSDLDQGMRPPQSYMYLRDQLLDRAAALSQRSTDRKSLVRRSVEQVLAKVLAPVSR